jgi:secondary thiamine-phosphate synthase enzyme
MNKYLYSHKIQTQQNEQFIDITSLLKKYVKDSNVEDGILIVYCPHTTAGITINENADPDVIDDMLYGLDKIYPKAADYKHIEGNSHAHLKASAIGISQSIIISNSNLVLGTWQGIYFCEFDGPRNRTVIIKIIEG